MSVIDTEVKEALAYFKTSKPVYRIYAGYGNTITFGKTGNATSDNNDQITQLIKTHSRVEEVFDFETRAHRLSKRNYENIVSNLQFEMIRFFPSFINSYHTTKNNKLTILYRWYNGALHQSTFNRHPELEKDLWAIFKWLKTEKHHSRCNPVTVSAINLLDVIRQRYEAKGIKL